jgi:predicted transcriptional regulator
MEPYTPRKKKPSPDDRNRLRVRLPEDLADRLEEYAVKHDLAPSTITIRALEAFLSARGY